MRQKLIRGGALLIFASLATACASGQSDSTDMGVTRAEPGYALDEADSFSSAIEEGGDSAGSDMSQAESDIGQAEEADPNRQIVTTGNIYIRSSDPFETADAVLELIDDVNGLIEEQSQRGSVEDDNAEVSLTVRVPAGDASETVAALEEATDVYEVDTRKEDVTGQVSDVNARIAALETSVERLTTLMAEAGSSEALIEAENALTQRQAELDGLRAVQEDLSDRVSMATFHISISSERVQTTAPEGFFGGIKAGWDGLVSAFLGVVTALGVLTPWLIVLVPVAVIALLLWRRYAHKRKADTKSTRVGPALPKAKPKDATAPDSASEQAEE